MQAVVRTPNSILKRRNKENEDATGRLNKRSKANRRVSFAPDDELATKHIFKQDADQQSTGELPIAHGVGPAQAVAAAVEATDVLPSPENLSPLSMDLTNNSLERPIVPAAGTGSDIGSCTAGPAGGPSMQPQPQAPPHPRHNQHAPYARSDVTINVPNLSTLVEEDEEEYCTGGSSSCVGGASMHPAVIIGISNGYSATDSPMSLTSVSELQMCRDREREPTTKDAVSQHFWGFPPGQDDTLEVNYRNVVMGEKTYNHVYGTGTINDTTRILDTRTGHVIMHAGGASKLAQPIDCAWRESLAARDVDSPARAGLDDGTRTTMPLAATAAAVPREIVAKTVIAGVDGAAAPPALPEHAPVAPAAGGVPLAQQAVEQGPEQRQPQTELSTIRTQLLQPFNGPPGLVRQPLQVLRAQVQSTPFGENTMRLLQEDDQTEPWRMPGHPGAYDRGRISVASNRVPSMAFRRGVAGGDTTMLLGQSTTLASIGNGNTVQLLADTTNHRGLYDQIAQEIHVSPAAAPPPVPPRANATGAQPNGPVGALRAAASQHAATGITRNLSEELKLGTSGDLLDDIGFTLDAHFQVPPEPTMPLSQLPGSGQVQGTSVGALALAPPATVRPTPPRLSCQEFLSLIETSFINKVCRDTFQPRSDPLPKSVVEVLEASTCTSAYVDAYHALSLDLAARLASIGTSVGTLEGELMASKQELFAAVQALPSAELETLKDKFANLKELCRLRMVERIKQTQLDTMEEHRALLRSRKQQLSAELEAVMADFERLKTCSVEGNTISAQLTCMRQDDEKREQETNQRKRRLEMHKQRLQALRTQNLERERRFDLAKAEQHTKAQSRLPLAAVMDERRELEARGTVMRCRFNNSALTPGQEGQLVRQAARKADIVEAMLNLNGLRLDLTNVEQNNMFRLVFRRAYAIVCTGSGNSVHIRVTCHDSEAAGIETLAPSIRDRIYTTASALSCTVSRTQLPLRLECMLEQLQRLLRLAQQLESCWMKLNCMVKPRADVGADGREAALVLRFINSDTATGVTIRMPWLDAVHSDYVKPRLSLELTSLEPEETQRKYCEALQATVLSKLAPSRGYLAAVCYAMKETLHVSSNGSA